MMLSTAFKKIEVGTLVQLKYHNLNHYSVNVCDTTLLHLQNKQGYRKNKIIDSKQPLIYLGYKIVGIDKKFYNFYFFSENLEIFEIRTTFIEKLWEVTKICTF